MKRSISLTGRRAGLIAIAAVGITGVYRGTATADQLIASATLRDASNITVGSVKIYDVDRRSVVRVSLRANANVTPAQFHGFHIHAGNDPLSATAGCVADPAKPATTWFVSAGGHFKQDGQNHGRHNGDLQSLLVNADGTASSEFTTDRFAPGDLTGRAIVLHAGVDNFGGVPTGTAADQYTANSPAAVTKTQNTGNSGDRVACGVIKLGGGRGEDNSEGDKGEKGDQGEKGGDKG